MKSSLFCPQVAQKPLSGGVLQKNCSESLFWNEVAGCRMLLGVLLSFLLSGDDRQASSAVLCTQKASCGLFSRHSK